jgi:hypothetical protein
MNIKLSRQDFYKLRIYTYKLIIFFVIFTLFFYIMKLDRIVNLAENINKISSVMHESVDLFNDIKNLSNSGNSLVKENLKKRINREFFFDPETSKILRDSLKKIKIELDIK